MDARLIAIAPFERRHGARRLGPVGMLASRKLREAHSPQTCMQMNASLAGRARLSSAQARARFGLADKTCDRATRWVLTVERLG